MMLSLFMHLKETKLFVGCELLLVSALRDHKHVNCLMNVILFLFISGVRRCTTSVFNPPVTFYMYIRDL